MVGFHGAEWDPNGIFMGLKMTSSSEIWDELGTIGSFSGEYPYWWIDTLPRKNVDDCFNRCENIMTKIRETSEMRAVATQDNLEFDC